MEGCDVACKDHESILKHMANATHIAKSSVPDSVTVEDDVSEVPALPFEGVIPSLPFKVEELQQVGIY